MSQGLFSVGGIASGLDTHDIIEQLMKLERQPLVRLQQQQNRLRTVQDAWQQVTTKLSSLRGAVDAISRPHRFDDLVKVTSSNPDAVSVTRNGSAPSTDLSFTVDRLAIRMQQSSTDAFESTSSTIGDRTLSITVDDVTYDVTDDLGPDATLADLVEAVNDLGVGVKARALQVAPGNHQLVLESTKTGTANTFSVTADNWEEDFTVTQEAEDALLQVGGIPVTRSSNTITDLVDGVTITLRKPTDASVTITAERDVDGAVKAVKGFADALNGVIKTIGELSKFDPETREAGPLQGQQAAMRLAFSLSNAAARPVTGLEGLAALGSSAGLELNRDGTFTVDEAKLRAAFTDDWDGTVKLFSRTGSATSDAVSSVTGATRTEPGTYAVEITKAADIARVTGAEYLPPDPSEPKTFRIVRPGGVVVTITIDSEHATVGAAVAKINQALEEAGEHNLVATETADGEIELAEKRYGSAHQFTVEALDEFGEPNGGDAFGLAGTHVGEDVEGTIDGQAATGVGRTLTATTGAADGLAVTVTGQPAPFEATYSRGIGGEVAVELGKAEGVSGIVARARASLDSQIKIYQTRIDGFAQRLETREATLRRQFVGLETALAQLNDQSAWLSQQITNLNAMHQPRR